MENNPRLIESPIRFSSSQLWKIQHNYFRTMGIEAWKEEVPFYISSNRLTAHRYALLAVSFISDWRRLHPESKAPFYILETGAGTGKFSFYFLTLFKALLKEHGIDNQSFCYIITDVVENNITFCKENQSFTPFLEANELDFSIFNVEADRDFYLTLRQKKYSDIKSETPLIVIANYTFDCIKQDSFEYKDGKCYEVTLGLKSRYPHFNVETARHLDDLRLHYETKEVNTECYSEPILNDLLKEYALAFKDKDALIMIPLGALQFFDHLKVLAGSFFMIAGDKGLSLLEKLPLLAKDKRASYDGCYSFMVNFHAMGYYLEKKGGDRLLTQNGNIFKVNLFSMGTPFSLLSSTRRCFEGVIENEGPDEYCFIFDEFLVNGYRFGLKALLSFLRWSQWDPDAYAAIHDRLIELLPAAEQQLIEDIEHDLDKVKENVYRMNIGEDIFNLLGIFYHTRDKEEEALALYYHSIAVFGDRVAPHNNVAMIYEKQKNYPKALFHYQKALSADKRNRKAKRKIAQLTGKPYVAIFYPLVRGIGVAFLIALAFYTFKLTG